MENIKLSPISAMACSLVGLTCSNNTIQNSVMPTQATMKSVVNEKVKVKKLSMTTTIKI